MKAQKPEALSYQDNDIPRYSPYVSSRYSLFGGDKTAVIIVAGYKCRGRLRHTIGRPEQYRLS